MVYKELSLKDKVGSMSEEEQQVFFRLLCIAYENVKDDGRTGDQSDKKRG